MTAPTHDIDLRAAINAVSDVVQNRPRPLREMDQIYMKTGDMVMQSELVARTYKILGYEQGAVIPTLESFLAVVHPEDRDRVHEAIAAAQKHPDGHYEAEFRVRGPNGAELIQRAGRKGQKEIVIGMARIAGTAQDITEQRRMERALRAERERYRMVVEHLEDLLVRVDTDGRFEFVSPSYCRLFGKTEAELIGRTFMPLVHPEDRAATAASGYRGRDRAHTVTMEQRVETVRGERWLQWSDRAVLDAAGQVVGIVGLGRDITERKAAEAALKESHLELERHGEQLARLASQLTLTEQRERKRLAKVLHDELQQLLVGASFGFERIGRAAKGQGGHRRVPHPGGRPGAADPA